MKLTQKSLQATQRVCLFGAPKSGKSEMAGRLSEKYNLLWLDFENGWSVLKKLPEEWQDRVELIRIPDSKVYPIAIETSLKILKGGPTVICEEHGKVDCMICKKDSKPTATVCLDTLDHTWIVVFDSGTQLANSAMNHITKAQPDDFAAGWEEFRKQGTLMDKVLSQLQQADYNVVFITHEAEVEMEDGKKKLVPVSGTTNFSRNTAKYFDHVVYADVKNKKHNYSSGTTAHLNILTGSRTDIKIEDMEAPSLMDIFDGKVGSVKITPAKTATNLLTGIKK